MMGLGTRLDGTDGLYGAVRTRMVGRGCSAAPLLVMALCSGCYSGYGGGLDPGEDTQTGSDGADDGADETDTDSGDGSTGDVPAGACADAPLGVTAMRRLTSAEYRNTVRDLFGVEPPAQMLPSDSHGANFRTTAGQALTPGATSKYFDAARFVAETLSTEEPGWFPCSLDDACVDAYLRDEGLRVFRRPLSDEEIDRYHAIFTARMDAGDTADASADIMLQALLVSPHFLFLEQPGGEPGERAQLNDWQIASRLSFLLWASTPDDALLEAAASGDLSTPQARAEAAQRLLEDPRAEQAIDAFFMQWTTAENISLVSRDSELYPELVPELTNALEEETRMYFREIFWNRGASLAELFTSPVRVRNGALSQFYGDGLVPADQTEFSIVEGDPTEQQFGLLSQAGLLMAIGRNADAQIIHRGVFVQNKLLCQHITLAATDEVPPLPDIDQDATSRERIGQHTAAPACAGCHALINPPGFALEHFDTTGRWRDAENGLPIDASADLVGVSDSAVEGALGLSKALATSDLVRSCATEQMFEFAIGREPSTEDRCVLDELSTAMVDSGDDLQALLVEIVASEAFAQRVAPQD